MIPLKRAGPVKTEEPEAKRCNSRGNLIDLCGSAAASGSSQLDKESSSEIRILLTGGLRAGKSSIGNTILGREAFPTREGKPDRETDRCDVRKGEVAGRRISIVDTPWFKRKNINKEVEKEMMVQLSSPGPHAVVILISLGLINDHFIYYISECQQYLRDLCGEAVFRHALILFTHADRLGGLTVEQYIEKQAEERRKRNQGFSAEEQQTEEEINQREREYLQQLMEKCGNRCCFFNNKNKSDRRQVIELLETIEAMMRENGGAHHTFDQYQRILPLDAEQILREEWEQERREKVTELQEEMRKLTEQLEEKTRALEREQNKLERVITEVDRYYRTTPVDWREEIRKRMKSEKMCGSAAAAGSSQLSQESISEIRILLTGDHRAGKSSSGNTILGREAFHTGEEDTDCETTEHCDVRKGEVAGRYISIVDTPQFCKDRCDKVEKEMMVQLSSPGPHAVILVISLELIIDNVINYDISEYQQRLQELCGEAVFRHALILFTHADRLGGLTVEQYIEKQAEERRKRNQGFSAEQQQRQEERIQKGREDLQQLMEKCGNRCCVFSNNSKSDRRQVIELLETIVAMMGENGGAHCTFDQYQRILPLEAEQRLREEREQERREKVTELQEEKRRVKEQLEEMKREIEKKKDDLQKEINEVHRYYSSRPLDSKEMAKLIRKLIHCRIHFDSECQ
ncbi:GTPase IMAP family member 8 [Amia ocellicauda]|uniref:GTPase IMAP family member 8 n=1 Tax=Amia ocellicauda TaxID=2972642 RepID=UPI0034642DF4